VVEKIKTAIDPDSIFRDGLVFLWIYRPVAGERTLAVACHISRTSLSDY
jgi:hypothetical protein